MLLTQSLLPCWCDSQVGEAEHTEVNGELARSQDVR